MHHTLSRQQTCNRWNRDYPPLLTIEPGDTVSIAMKDASDGQVFPGMDLDAFGAIDKTRIHALTGPIEVAVARGRSTIPIKEIPSADSAPQAPSSERERLIWALEQSGWVEAAAVLVLPAPRPRLAAVVLPNAAGRQCLAELGAFRFGRRLRALLARTHEPACLPRQWRFVTVLPAARLGTRDEAGLRALFGDSA